MVRPLLAGWGATPQSLAKAFSLRMRLGVVSGGDEELAGEFDAHAEEPDEIGRGGVNDGLDLLVKCLDLAV